MLQYCLLIQCWFLQDVNLAAAAARSGNPQLVLSRAEHRFSLDALVGTSRW